MGNRTNQIFETIREKLDDDESIETGTISMKGMDTVNVEVFVSLPDGEVDEHLEGKRDELLELLPDGVDLRLEAVSTTQG